eukprot:3611489-Lingulodinium_polyedra.AAC.1
MEVESLIHPGPVVAYLVEIDAVFVKESLVARAELQSACADAAAQSSDILVGLLRNLGTNCC